MAQLFEMITGSRMLQLALCSGLGLAINLMLGLYGHQWSALKSQRYCAIILPPAGAIITWTISSNLALSLGMIGALSIVRFRTPVKNPFELVIFFVYLILGISAGVNPVYTVSLALLVMATPVFVAILDQILPFFGSRLRSRTEFSTAPVQLVAQVRQKTMQLPSGIPVNEVVSLSSQPDQDTGELLIDFTVSFHNNKEALACLESLLEGEQVVYSSMRAVES